MSELIEAKPESKKRGGMPAFVPTSEQRIQVKAMSEVGVPRAQIAKYLRICDETLNKYFMNEIEDGLVEANTAVGRSLFQQAQDGNVAAAIFWAKVRMGWTEKNALELTGPNNGPVVIETNLNPSDAYLKLLGK